MISAAVSTPASAATTSQTKTPDHARPKNCLRICLPPSTLTDNSAGHHSPPHSTRYGDLMSFTDDDRYQVRRTLEYHLPFGILLGTERIEKEIRSDVLLYNPNKQTHMEILCSESLSTGAQLKLFLRITTPHELNTTDYHHQPACSRQCARACVIVRLECLYQLRVANH